MFTEISFEGFRCAALLCCNKEKLLQCDRAPKVVTPTHVLLTFTDFTHRVCVRLCVQDKERDRDRKRHTSHTATAAVPFQQVIRLGSVAPAAHNG